MLRRIRSFAHTVTHVLLRRVTSLTEQLLAQELANKVSLAIAVRAQ
jgi:hypothetical protein